ncbi:MAG: methyltransferase domain-containing protein [Kineosporiaceae bacterium]
MDDGDYRRRMDHYVHGHAEAVLRSHRSRTAEDSAAYLLPHLRPGQRLLDVGCGPGTITADLAGRVAPGPVLAVDPSADVVEQAARHCRGRGVTNLHVRVGDIYTLDLPDASFDVVHAHQVLQHLPDPIEALRRMRRLTAPGGLVAARDADYAAMTWYPQVPGLEEWRALYRSLARRSGGQPDAGRRLLAWALQAGFTDVTPGASTWCYATAEARTWWGGMWADRIVDSAIARQALETGAALQGDLDRMRAAWQEWASDPCGWFVIVHGEVLCRVGPGGDGGTAGIPA